jgi:hypothetical protein
MGGFCGKKGNTVDSVLPQVAVLPVKADSSRTQPIPQETKPSLPKPDPFTKPKTPVKADSPRIQPIPLEAKPSSPKPDTPSPIIQPSTPDPPKPIISPSSSQQAIDDSSHSPIKPPLPQPNSSIPLIAVSSAATIPAQNAPIVPEVFFQLQVKDIKGLTDFTISMNPKWKGLQLFEKIKEKTGGNREFQVVHFGKLIKCDEEEIGNRGLSQDTLIYCIFKPKSLQ